MVKAKVKTAMLLAAGRGERMRPLTDSVPKPLLKVKGKPLLEYHMQALKKAGIQRVVINHAWLGQQIVDYFADGDKWGLEILYSAENPALETAGGIIKALPLLGDEAFMVINGDVFCDYPIDKLQLAPGLLAHLVLVANPAHNPEGDFALERNLARSEGNPAFTFSGIGIYHPDFFADCATGTLALAPILRQKMSQNQVSAEVYNGFWCDVGTPERLQQLNEEF